MSVAGRGRFDRSGGENDPIALQEISRRMNNLVRQGTIAEVDHKKAKVRIKIGPLKTDWLPWHEQRAGDDVSWNPPSKGEQVTVLSVSGDLAQGIVLGSIYQKKYDAPSQKGEERVMKHKDGSVTTHNVEKKTRDFTMPKEGKKTLQIGELKKSESTDGHNLQVGKTTVATTKDAVNTNTQSVLNEVAKSIANKTAMFATSSKTLLACG